MPSYPGWIPADDRGLLYGDGVFTTLAVDAGRPLLWPRHQARLREGCERLGIAQPDAAAMETEVVRHSRELGRGVLKCLLTRGSGGRGYCPPRPPAPRLVFSTHPFPDYPPQNFHVGVRLRLCRLRLGRNPALAGIKHLNRLENVLARGEWDDPEIAEGVLLDSDGWLVEATMSNVFFVREACLHTPSLEYCGVAGVVRAALLETARAWGVTCRVGDYGLEALLGADEVFLSNSVLGLWPVRQIEQTRYAVGPLTRRLQQELHRQKWIVDYA